VSTTTGPRERNRRGHGARLRTDIVTAAADLLDEAGTEQAVTLRAVARRVGISAPSIYAHFPDREAILLAVVQGAFADLSLALNAADPGADADATARLWAVATAYLDFAATRPQRYRVMFGGLWNATDALRTASVATDDVAALGQDTLAVFVTALNACVAEGRSTSTDTGADVVALWLGLHGLAHQRAVLAAFPWPPDITERLVTALARLYPRR
jgi:AcrR family transcriptional regulator